jgi:anaerobic magnesium-protoporphyrin IX monomethyl ester cyclase
MPSGIDTKRILLVNAPTKFWNACTPVGLAAIAAYLREKRVAVKVIDAPADGKTITDVAKIAVEEGYSLVGISGMTHQIKNAYALAREIHKRAPDTKVLLGGVHASMFPREALRKGIDYVIIGEGELTTWELLCALKKGSALDKIAGLGFMKGGHPKINAEREFIPNIDVLPVPARDLLPIEKYTDEKIFGNVALEVMFSRGCPYNCVFCSSPKLWRRRVRSRSIGKMISELRALVKTYGIKYFVFNDDSFTINKKFLLAFCRRLNASKLGIKWRCLTRVNIIDEEMLREMKGAGCVLVSYGVESGNQGVLNFVSKNITLEHIRRAIKITRKVGLPYGLLMIVGHPTETYETAMQSIRLMGELDPYSYGFQMMVPFVGTQLHDKLAKKTGKILSKDWEEYVTGIRPIFLPNDLTEEQMLELFTRSNIGNTSPRKALNRIIAGIKLIGLDALNTNSLKSEGKGVLLWSAYTLLGSERFIRMRQKRVEKKLHLTDRHKTAAQAN